MAIILGGCVLLLVVTGGALLLGFILSHEELRKYFLIGGAILGAVAATLICGLVFVLSLE
ncbi:MAG: hypothetical protein KF770_05810 [Anaerolineae bacterium]|nr:hypothetical protein [Anaerolineae bacterium]